MNKYTVLARVYDGESERAAALLFAHDFRTHSAADLAAQWIRKNFTDSTVAIIKDEV